MIALNHYRPAMNQSARLGGFPQLSPLPAVRFTPSAEFSDLTLDQIQRETPSVLFREDLQESSRLLTPEGERHFFRLMNFQLHSANKLATRDVATRSSASRTLHIQQYHESLKAAAHARTILVECNLRLVMGLARQFANRLMDYEDLLSEGNLILLNAIDRFDYSKNFRFSTYATHSIQRHFVRVLNRSQRRSQKELSVSPELLATHSRPANSNIEYDVMVAEVLKKHFSENLSSREQTILRERFGLDGQEAATLKELAEQIGLSKERVRQVQITAINKLLKLADTLKLSPEFDSHSQSLEMSQAL